MRPVCARGCDAMSTMLKEFGLFIDGEWRAAADGRGFASINPATGEPWAHVAAAGPTDVDAAVGAARRAFSDGRWRKLPAAERGAVLGRIAQLVLERADELAALEVTDAGGTIRKANMADIPATAQTFQYYADLLSSLPEEEVFDETVPVPSRNRVRREPI